MRFYAYSPLARGVLTGKFSQPDVDNMNQLQKRYMTPAMGSALTALNAACAAHGVAMKDAALRWLVHHSVLSRGHDDGVILGGSSLEQLRENAVAASAGTLPATLVEALDAANEALHPVPAFPTMGVMKL